jgi:hypothetical protein
MSGSGRGQSFDQGFTEALVPFSFQLPITRCCLIFYIS